MIGTSPAGPLRCGSTTCRAKPVATAASNALPPFSRIAMPAAVASQWVEATTPKVPLISGRVVKLGMPVPLAVLREGSAGVLDLAHVEEVAQGIADEVDRQHR